MSRSGCYRLERQLPGGICTRKEGAPFHGARKESRKFNWGCTICRPCRSTRSDSIVSIWPENRGRLAGILASSHSMPTCGVRSDRWRAPGTRLAGAVMARLGRAREGGCEKQPEKQSAPWNLHRSYPPGPLQGLTSSRGSASVTVDNDPPGQPTVTASCTETACTFTATAIDDWTPSANLTYSWDGGESGQSITRSYTTPGTKRASVTATDAQGRTSPSGSGSGYIPVPNEAPGQPTVTGSCDPMTGTANAGTAQQRCTFTATATDDSTPSVTGHVKLHRSGRRKCHMWAG